MSSDDSGFDKEAEREKLREKYGDDDQDRENTRRMSELLLQGATMTGKHCNQCSDPIFRYDGQEFCPTCQREVEGSGAQQGAAQRGDAQQNSTPQEAAQRQTPAESDEQPSGETEVAESKVDKSNAEQSDTEQSDAEQSDDEPRVEIDGVRVTGQHADRSTLRGPPSQQDDSGRREDGPTRRDETAGTRRQDHQHAHGHSSTASPIRASGAEDLSEARGALVRKLTDLARRAEETDDVTRARDLLGATREAAEALAALDRANR